jgi:hypothetical protein
MKPDLSKVSDMELLAELTRRSEALPAPARTARLVDTSHWLYAIGDDHVATVEIANDALEELEKLVAPTPSPYVEDKVVLLHPAADPDVVLRTSIGEYAEVLVIGYTPEGQFRAASSDYFADGGACLWAIETFKHKLLSGEFAAAE